MNNIVNIINFVRASEPREQDNSYLPVTLKNELELCHAHSFGSSVLLQYDALIGEEYQDIVSEYKNEIELGIWLEIVEPLCVDAEIEWKGRYPWDWVNNVDFLCGYTLPERERLIDTAYNKFNEIFGYYPQVFGCWNIDVYSLAYIEKKYGARAACICRDQYGTDGITIWGGYYNCAYYPSKKNMLCPAKCADEQINIPVFRMLGSDPIYQYDMGLGAPDCAQGVNTLEPVYPYAGGNRQWVENYFRENFNGKSLAIAYTQMGQENSFGWNDISKGLPMQFEVLDANLKDGRVGLMTLGEAGDWFRENFSLTPPTAMCTDNDLHGNGRKGIWYNCRNYRMNVIYDEQRIHIRDFQLFDSNFEEKYLTQKETLKNCAYFNLPVVDGFRFSKNGIVAGAYIYRNGEEQAFDGEFVTDAYDKTAFCSLADKVRIEMTESNVKIILPDDCIIRILYSPDCDIPYVSASEKTLNMSFAGRCNDKYEYQLSLDCGLFEIQETFINIFPEKGQIIIRI